MKRLRSMHPRASLCASALALFIARCASAAPTAQHPANVATLPPQATTLQASMMPIDASLYTQELGEWQMGALQRTQRNDGYTVESASLVDGMRTPAGSLIGVRSPDGALTAIIDRPDRRGLLLVDAQGKRRFLEEPAYDYLRPDTLAEAAPKGLPPAQPTPGAGGVIDALVAFSNAALISLGSDPTAFALAQLETVNLGLRNAKVENVRVELAGIVVTDTDRSVDSQGLRDTDRHLGQLRSSYRHDINIAYGKHAPNAGIAYVPGLSSINGIDYPLALRHEIGHNVGGGHCYPDRGDNYKHGHSLAPGQATHLCGNSLPFYSTPNVSIAGKPLGNATTADMARLWREQASRLANAGPAFDGERMIVLSSQGERALQIGTMPTSTSAGVVAISPRQGPVELTANAGPHTLVYALLRNENGQHAVVAVRAQKQVGTCSRTGMNSNRGCHPLYDRGAFSLFVSFHAEDNPSLPSGWYSGTLELKAVDAKYPDWSRPILISLSVHR